MAVGLFKEGEASRKMMKEPTKQKLDYFVRSTNRRVGHHRSASIAQGKEEAPTLARREEIYPRGIAPSRIGRPNGDCRGLDRRSTSSFIAVEYRPIGA